MGNHTPKLTKEGHPQSIEDFEALYQKYRLSKHNQSALDEGICRGMCYDWIRLILHGRGQLFINYQTLSGTQIRRVYALQTGINKIFLKGADLRIQGLIADSRKNYQLQVAAQQRLLRAQALARESVVAEKALKLVATSGYVGAADTAGLQLLQALNTERADLRIDQMERIQEEFDAYGRKVEEIGRKIKDDETNFSHYFEYFQREFSRQSNSTYTFSDLFYERGLRHGWTQDRLKQWLAHVQAHIQQLRDGCCALLNIRKKSGSGHFVAFHRAGVKYSLFDPNTGWYQIQGANNVWKMFVDLWHCAYMKFGYNESLWRVFFKVDTP